MTKAPWKNGKVLSVETRPGHYAIIQLLQDPFVAAFTCFSNEDRWEHISLEDAPILFITAVTRQFLTRSRTRKLEIAPAVIESYPVFWIRPSPVSRQKVVFEGTTKERSFILMGKGGTLIQRNIEGSEKDRDLGRPPTASELKTCELTNIEIYPSLNERLFLCAQAGRNVNPLKELIFDQPIPEKYERIIDIFSA